MAGGSHFGTLAIDRNPRLSCGDGQKEYQYWYPRDAVVGFGPGPMVDQPVQCPTSSSAVPCHPPWWGLEWSHLGFGGAGTGPTSLTMGKIRLWRPFFEGQTLVNLVDHRVDRAARIKQAPIQAFCARARGRDVPEGQMIRTYLIEMAWPTHMWLSQGAPGAGHAEPSGRGARWASPAEAPPAWGSEKRNRERVPQGCHSLANRCNLPAT
eukprot:COSAG06_NODE_2914_length_6099_cov_4.555333_4_plen_209_part_00